jgi:hypothetical protein
MLYWWPRERGTPVLCPDAKQFHMIIQETIFAKISEMTTPEQFSAAQQSLLVLYQELSQQLGTYHFATANTGSHRCLKAVYLDAAMRLKNLAIMHEQPQPPPPPRRRPPRSADEVVNDVSSLADQVKRPGDTFLGEERKDNQAPGGTR